MTIRECIDDFLIEQQVRGNSPKTQKHYFRCLGLFERFQSPKNPDISAVSVSDCKAYYIHLSNRNVSSVTVQTYIRALRAFLSWCYLEGYIPENIPKKFRLPKAQKKKIDILTDSEVEQLFRCLSGRDFISIRNYCIVALMIDSGLRLNEVVTIRRDKIHIAEGYAIVNGKGNKERFVPLGLNSKRALLRYCAIVPNKEKETPLFVKDTFIRKRHLDSHKREHRKTAFSEAEKSVGNTSFAPSFVAAYLCYTVHRARRRHLQLAVDSRSYIARNGEKVCALDSLKNGSQLCGSFALG